MRRWTAALPAALLTMVPALAQAFCGFYVTGADARLYANATMVVLMRDGNRTVLSMQNNYQGPPEDFAVVIPVPVVLQRENVKTLSREVFEHVDHLAAPRLVEYWEQDPCAQLEAEEGAMGQAMPSARRARYGAGGADDLGVRIEAQFQVGEYDIVILSASDSMGLDTWLRQNRYRIPEGAEEVLRPYVQGGSKFFVAKVDASRVTFRDGQAMLSPLRFHYDSDEFSLPVRLGLLNSAGTQDLIVHILSPDQRWELANYPNVTIPTNLDVADSVRERFPEFYAALFDRTLERNPRAVITEYAWQATNCDPCPGPVLSESDLTTLGADVLPTVAAGQRQSTLTVVDATPRAPGIPGDVAQMIVNRQLSAFRSCHQGAMSRGRPLPSTIDVDLRVDSSGLIAGSPTVSGADSDFAACLLGPLRSLRFPPPEGGAQVPVHARLALNSEAPNPWQLQQRMQQFVLTRLHARYSREALGQDLVFRQATPIVGGREHVVGADGKLEEGSRPDRANNFQARYAIRHRWTGAIACASPRRGIWGGPPGGQATPAVRPATDLAFAPRGQARLESMVRQNVPEIGLTAAAASQPGATGIGPGSGTGAASGGVNTADAPAGAVGGCGCDVVDPSPPAALLILLAAAGLFALIATVRRNRR